MTFILQGMEVHQWLECGRKASGIIGRHEPQGPGLFTRVKKNVLEMALGSEDMTLYLTTVKKSMMEETKAKFQSGKVMTKKSSPKE